MSLRFDSVSGIFVALGMGGIIRSCVWIRANGIDLVFGLEIIGDLCLMKKTNLLMQSVCRKSKEQKFMKNFNFFMQPRKFYSF